jgi:acyl-CoA synthetase (AMP-forming)/AMP-acid ligase II
LTSVRRVLSAGAAVPSHLLASIKDSIHPEGEVHTPYGATEALPVASISGAEVLGETRALTERGAGVCVGRRFPHVEWQIIEIDDGPIPQLAAARPLPAGQIGELIVHGPAVTREYVTCREANALAKIADGESLWHRTGDVGYLDRQDRFWYCGRKSQRVVTATGTLFTEQCEAILNQHPGVVRCALVGIGPPGGQRPAIVAEPYVEELIRWRALRAARERLLAELGDLAAAHEVTSGIDQFLLCRTLPVDIRHNSKIFREKLAAWAAGRLPAAEQVTGR